MGCCDSKPQDMTRGEPSFSLPAAPPEAWMQQFRLGRDRQASEASVGSVGSNYSARGNRPHSNSAPTGMRAPGGSSLASGGAFMSFALADGFAEHELEGSKLFAPKQGTNLIFQEASSSDVLCVDKHSPERACLISSHANAAVFKVASTVKSDQGALLAIQCLDRQPGGGGGSGSAGVSPTSASAAGPGGKGGAGGGGGGSRGGGGKEDFSGSFLYFSDQRQRLHSGSLDPTPLWQLVELMHDVVDGQPAGDPTYLLRAVAKWWFPAVVLRRCGPPNPNIILTQDGHERAYSITYHDGDNDGGDADARDALSATPPVPTTPTRGGDKKANDEGGVDSDYDDDGEAGDAPESPSAAAFRRLQKNASEGFSSAFESALTPGPPTKVRRRATGWRGADREGGREREWWRVR
jgi:hypothetical protein